MRNTLLLALLVLLTPFVLPTSAFSQADVIELEPEGPAVVLLQQAAQPVPVPAPPGAPVAKSDDKKDKPKEEEPEPELPPEPPVKLHPQVIRLYLMDGSVITGKLAISDILVETSFGKLNVPIENIRTFTPGLGSHPELTSRINGLIEDLGSSEYGTRERAQKALLKIGLPALGALEKHRDDTDTERRKRIKTLLEEMEDIQESLDDDFSEETTEMDQSLMIQRDTVVTTEFTMVGKIVPKTFNIASPYGALTIKLSDIRSAKRDVGRKPDVKKSLTVDGTHIVQRGTLDTKIRVERGDRVFIEATGTITMTPWGNRAMTTPDGAPNYGWYMPNQIPSGALMGKVGKGNYFKVGSKHNFTVEKTGELHLAVGMQQDYANNNFPGRYNIKILVKRKQ